MALKKLRDAEFRGWHAMNAIPSNTNLWIYFSPDNQKAALANIMTGEVLFVMGRMTGEKLYESPNLKKTAKTGYAFARKLI